MTTGVSLLFLRWHEQFKTQQQVETIRRKLETDLNHLLRTRKTTEIAAVMQTNLAQKRIHVERQLNDGSKMDEFDLGAYLLQLQIGGIVKSIQINEISFDVQGNIQRIVIVEQL